MRLACALVAVASLVAPAAADPQYTQVSLPLLLGGGSDGFTFGWRPEVIVASNQPRGGAGIGGYVELAHDARGASAAIGMTGVRYMDRRFALAPSLGMSTRGIEGGMFVGLRRPNEYHLEAPLGLRVDGHFHSDGSADVIVAAQIDLVPLAVLGVALAQVMHRHD
ncbi:MAG: hypothetical protein ACM31C_04685 [Acidobacteriota bacterium]